MTLIHRYQTFMTATPRELGFCLPAEWAPHTATWIAWPHETTDWPGKFHPVPWVYCDIVKKLSAVERVRILCESRDAEQRIRKMLEKTGANMAAVDFFSHHTNRSWCRDFCPIFVKNAEGQVAITDWIFNGWAKYPNYEHDNAIPAWLAPQLQMQIWSPGFVLEGGAIDVNGAGKMIVTEECLLSDVQARNPGRSREEMEQVFAEYLGVTETIWLKNGISGDDTHGHIDDLARFTDEQTIALVVEEDPSDANFEPLQENLRILESRSDLRVVPLPMPRPVYFDGQRLPVSYANFYIANEIVLVPTFNDPADAFALNTIAELFPTRQIIGIHCLDLVLGLGTLHCMTMQQPA
jgi:agmatine deiminase